MSEISLRSILLPGRVDLGAFGSLAGGEAVLTRNLRQLWLFFVHLAGISKASLKNGLLYQRWTHEKIIDG